MQQTFFGYIDNPMGKGATMPQKQLIQQSLEQKYGQLMLKEAGNFHTYIFQPTKEDKYYIHMKVPSESTERIYYDVVIEFSPDNKSKGEASLRNYFVRFYSNDPSFVFTYANAFKSKGLFIEELSSKISTLSMRKEAIIRNPNANIGYVKVFYFAFLYMKSHNLFNKQNYAGGLAFDWGSLRSNIMHSSDKLKEVNEVRAATAKKKKAEREKARKSNLTKSKTNKITKEVSKVKTTKKVSTVKSVKKTKYHK